MAGAALGAAAIGTAAAAAQALADAPAAEPGAQDGAGQPDAQDAADTYRASYRGCQGFVDVEAVIRDGQVQSLSASGPFETEGIGTYALQLLPDQIVAANSVDVDAVAGATMTSTAILKAAAMAMVEAGMDVHAAPAAQAYTPGTYTAAYKGHMGPVTVSVTFSDSAITAVELGDNTETPSLVNAAMEHIAPAVVDGQTLAVDAVATATYSARAILQGIADCVSQAGGDPAALRRPVIDNPVKAADETMDADVVVVGGGTSGSIALYRLAQAGLKAVCLESGAAKGGMGEIAGFSRMRWYGSSLQKSELGLDDAWVGQHVEEDVEAMYLASGQMADKRMLRAVAAGCGPMVDMLQESGMELACDSETGVKIPSKGQRWQGLFDAAAELGCQTLLGHHVEQVLTGEDGSVAGVVARRDDGSLLTVSAPAVILASGGAAANRQIMADYYPNYTQYVENCSISTVDGAALEAAWEAGAAKADFGVHAHNHTLPLTAKLAGISTVEATDPVATLGNTPLLWLDRSGRRFCNEAECYSPTPGGNIVYFGRRVFDIVDQATVDAFTEAGSTVRPWRGIQVETPMPDLPAQLEAGEATGYVYKADTLEELSEKLGWDAQVVADEVARYNAMVAAGADTDYAKPAEALVYTVETGPFYAVEIHPRSLGSFGGLKVDKDYGVCGEDGKPIPGLFACGDMACGWFGVKYPDINGLTSFHNTTSGYVAAGSAIDYLA